MTWQFGNISQLLPSISFGLAIIITIIFTYIVSGIHLQMGRFLYGYEVVSNI